ncbi:MAG TPA: family 43 glycosylhydrolase [Acidimicrobiales bacterium]|nr:family 43 glycosylhydrolase [Acidimicrobiales bacterium]
MRDSLKRLRVTGASLLTLTVAASVVTLLVTQRASAVTLHPSTSPAFAGDAGDPDVVFSSGTYFAFTTGTPLGNHIQALVSSNASSGYHSYTGHAFGSTALATTPGWETVNTQTSPGVFDWGGHWLMYYDAAQAPNQSDTGHDCISVAIGGSTLSASSPQFTDNSGGGLICQPTGSIDPSPFVDPANGNAYLVWKQNDGGSTSQATIWSQQLSADGLGLVGPVGKLMINNTTAYPWEKTVEDPSMVDAGGTFTLLFAAGIYTTSSYSEGITTCSGPLGPCGAGTQILTTYGSVLGPGGGSLFTDSTGAWWLDYAAWQGGGGGCADYSCGATRDLFTTPIQLSPQVPCSAPTSPNGYRFIAADGGVFDYGNLPFCGSMGGQVLDQPVVGIAATPDGGGYWEVASDGGVFSFGDAQFHGSMGGTPLVRPVVGMASTPSGRGYWEVASDGGIFCFGDAAFHGSMGGRPLARPVVAMAATPDGGGYWEVASDGGVFSFGDAVFHGSMGGKPLAQPVVGIAPTADGGGYWEVASDGGVFSFGDAVFHGSVGATPLARPVVGVAATRSGGGYREVASDGGIFCFGDAVFDGSMGGKPLVKPIVGMSP